MSVVREDDMANWTKLVLAAAAAIALAAAAGGASAEAKYKWKMQSLWQGGSINQKIFEDYCKRVGQLTGGRLEITPLPVGAVVAYTETLDALQNGILDAHQSGGPYFSGKEPALALTGDLNGGFETPYQMQMWYEYGGGLQLAREIYAKFNIHYVGPVLWGVESIPAKKRIAGVADFKGVKMRAPEGLSAEIWRRVGVGVVTLPGSEVYTALERGVIEATDWGTLGMNQDLGYHKIAAFPLYPGFHSMPAAEVAVNMDRWKELPDDIKAIVESATRDFNRDMIQRIALEDAKAAAAAKAANVELVNWTAEERKKFRQIAQQSWADWGKKSPMAQKVLDSQVAFMKRLGLLD
jgi:TRAP-type mannitol/chloroaromatic compound transport system substrate-binding protein